MARLIMAVILFDGLSCGGNALSLYDGFWGNMFRKWTRKWGVVKPGHVIELICVALSRFFADTPYRFVPAERFLTTRSFSTLAARLFVVP
jgi:hypothetical protein